MLQNTYLMTDVVINNEILWVKFSFIRGELKGGSELPLKVDNKGGLDNHQNPPTINYQL